MASRFAPLVVIAAFLLLAAFAVERTYSAYRWKQVADARGWQAQVCHDYLFSPIGKTPQGQEVRRVDALDYMIGQLLKGGGK